MAAVLDLLRLLVGTTILAFAAYTDWKWRRAPNALWMVLALAGVALLAADVALDPDLAREQWGYLLFIPGFAALVYALWWLGLVAGGADAKALMALGVLAPWPLVIGEPFPLLGETPLPGAFTVLANSLLLFMAIPLGFLLWNLAHGHVRLPHAFLGVKQRAGGLQRGLVWPMEMVMEDGTRRTRLFASRMEPDEMEAAYERLHALGDERVWVSPKVPFMIPLLLGFVAAFLLGDVLQWALRAILG